MPFRSSTARVRLLLTAALLLGACNHGGPVTLEESDAYDAYQSGLARAREARHDLAAEDLRRALAADDSHPEIHVALFNSLFRLERYRESRELLEGAATQFPDHAGIAFSLGLLYMRTGELEAAAGELERAVKLDPTNVEALAWQGRALYERAILFEVTGEISQERLDRAIALLERAIAAAPSNADYHYRLGLALEYKDEPEKALAQFAEAVVLAPDHADALRKQGSLLVRAGKLDDGRAALEKAVELDPKSAEAQYELGLALEEGGEQEGALAAYGRALELLPSFPEPRFRQSTVLRKLGRTEEADLALAAFEAWTKKEQELNSRRLAALAQPNDAVKHLELGLALIEARRLEEARTSVQRALEVAPDSPAGLHALARLQWNANELPAARANLERAIELAPGQPEWMYLLARLHLQMGETEPAYDLLVEVTSLAPDDPEAHVDLGLLLVGRDDLEGAKQHFEKALELDGQNVKALFNLGALHFQKGELDLAEPLWAKVVEIEPDHPKAARFLEELRKRRGG